MVWESVFELAAGDGLCMAPEQPSPGPRRQEGCRACVRLPGERCLPRGRGHALPRAPACVACAPAACARQLGAFLLLQVEPGRAEVSGRPCVGWVADLPVTLGAVAVLSNFRCRLRSSVGTGDTRRA